MENNMSQTRFKMFYLEVKIKLPNAEKNKLI
jgi:hypothetical protein